jgi:hypothetical protein
MSYTPWVHELNQVGQNVEVTVQVFEDSSTLLGEDQIPMPDLSSAYTLHGSGSVLLSDHVFSPDDAFEITDFQCNVWNPWISEECSSSELCEDCDDDGVAECDGFCAVAYRFLVVDECAEPGDAMYGIRTPETESVWYENEGLGFTNTVIEDTGDECLSDCGCIAAGAGGRMSEEIVAIFVLGIMLFAATLARRKLS